jgi:hypothetical protein
MRRFCDGLELNDAEARPAKATTKAKTRTAAFIFSNLSISVLKRSKFPLTHPKAYRIFSSKSIYFFWIIDY